MYKIATLNKISPVGLTHFTSNYEITDEISEASGILVRSQGMHDMEFHSNLMAVARAGAGVNNIPLEKCADSGIVVFNTPGANANAVKELVLAGLFMAARNIPEGISWISGLTDDISKSVEKGKGQFAGTELAGKTLGVIGLGAIGVKVANAAISLGMNVVGFDAFFNTKSALSLNSQARVYDKLEDLLPVCDYVTIHVPAMDSTKGMFNANVFDLMKNGAVLLNFSRDKLVDEASLLASLESGHLKKYITDFATDGIIGKSGVIALPHLGASTAEAEDNCATMAVEEIMDYIENGNVVNSVNFPPVNMGKKGDETRILFLMKDVSNPVPVVSEALSRLNILSISGGTRGAYGCVLVSVSESVDSLPEIKGVIKSRII